MTRQKLKHTSHKPVHVLIRKDHQEALLKIHPTLSEGIRRAVEEYLNRAEA